MIWHRRRRRSARRSHDQVTLKWQLANDRSVLGAENVIRSAELGRRSSRSCRSPIVV